jgi:hypothetical protein
METRSTRSVLHLRHPFVLPGSDAPLPAGAYVLIEEEERLQGLTFDAYRRTGTFLVVGGGPDAPGRTELRPMTGDDLTHLIAQDAATDAGGL